MPNYHFIYEQNVCNSYNNLHLKHKKPTYLGILGHSKKLEWHFSQSKKMSRIIGDEKRICLIDCQNVKI